VREEAKCLITYVGVGIGACVIHNTLDIGIVPLAGIVALGVTSAALVAERVNNWKRCRATLTFAREAKSEFVFGRKNSPNVEVKSGERKSTV